MWTRGRDGGLTVARLRWDQFFLGFYSPVPLPPPRPRAAFRAAAWLSHLPLEVNRSVLGLRSLREARLLEVAVGPFVSAEGLEGRRPGERPLPQTISLGAQARMARAARTGVPSRPRRPPPAARAASCRRPALRPGPRRRQRRCRCLRRAAVAFLHAGPGSRPSRPPPAPHAAPPAPRQMQAAAVLPEEIRWLLAGNAAAPPGRPPGPSAGQESRRRRLASLGFLFGSATRRLLEPRGFQSPRPRQARFSRCHASGPFSPLSSTCSLSWASLPLHLGFPSFQARNNFGPGLARPPHPAPATGPGLQPVASPLGPSQVWGFALPHSPPR